MSHGKKVVAATDDKTQTGHDTETDSPCIGRESPLTTPVATMSKTKVTAAESSGRPTSFRVCCLVMLTGMKSPNAKVSDGSQPPMMLNWSLSRSAGSRSLRRPARHFLTYSLIYGKMQQMPVLR